MAVSGSRTSSGYWAIAGERGSHSCSTTTCPTAVGISCCTINDSGHVSIGRQALRSSKARRSIGPSLPPRRRGADGDPQRHPGEQCVARQRNEPKARIYDHSNDPQTTHIVRTIG
ncbi:hypothetical protein ZIOFF_048895 [Zingiber officinale]|uniref:Uncharacterized protein n=1 Tax=Zingiber officinale TaxID=94328 RepID=A0A8J5KSY4_ZINOF|nr:hypothetical protein ZIOFF_048895 [Zingiber officinale]